MVSISKFTDKERRKARRSFQSNHIAHDLFTPKYRPRVNTSRKRIDNDDGSYYFIDNEDDEYEQWT